MPWITAVFSDSAITAPPAAFTASTPTAPSRPIPVSTTAVRRAPNAAAAVSNSRSTLGLYRLWAPSSSRSRPPASTVRCFPPGAIHTSPGPTAAPSLPSRTGNGSTRSSRLANASVNPAGMCWAISTAAWGAGGSAERRYWSPGGPPDEAPIAITGKSRGGERRPRAVPPSPAWGTHRSRAFWALALTSSTMASRLR